MEAKAVIYVAGPYTTPDPVENTKKAVEVGDAVWAMGVIPFVPHLSLFWHFHTHHPYEDWLDLDAQILLRCDGIIRIPGESSGADKEVAIAKAATPAIPVFGNFVDLGIWIDESGILAAERQPVWDDLNVRFGFPR